MNAVPEVVDESEDYVDPDAAFQARIAKGLKEMELADQKRQAYFAGMLDGPEPPLDH